MTLFTKPGAVVNSELFKRAPVYPIDARVANVKEMRRGGFDHQRAEGTDVATVTVVAILAAPALRIQPGVERADHALPRLFDRPRIGRAVVILHKAVHRRLRGLVTDHTGADAIGQRQHRAFDCQLRPVRNPRRAAILIQNLAAGTGALPQRQLQGRHLRRRIRARG